MSNPIEESTAHCCEYGADLPKCLPLDFNLARMATPQPPTGSYAALGQELSSFPTPLVAVCARALHHNLNVMFDWAHSHGFDLAPHGKTTMSRQLWQQQIDAGAWGITVATPWQLAQACRWGIGRLICANNVVDPRALAHIAALGAHHEILVWADSCDVVHLMDDALAAAQDGAAVGVLVELGALGGRTGARSIEQALRIAEAVDASPYLELRGIAAYEGAVAHRDDEASLTRVREYLSDVVTVHELVAREGLYRDREPIVSVGGSCYLDLVAEVLAPVASWQARVVVRAGAAFIHDDGFYEQINPLRRAGQGQLISAARGYATVISQPEEGLALLDGGRRDFPFDEGLPRPVAIRRRTPPGCQPGYFEPLDGVESTAINDQHLFVRWTGAQNLAVGDVIELGLSHPCTTFDKWSALPLVDDLRGRQPRVIDLIHTNFG